MISINRPVLLVAPDAPLRDDKTPGADWSMAVICLAWVTGHGKCGGLRAAAPGRLDCACGVLAFEVRDPYQIGAAA